MIISLSIHCRYHLHVCEWISLDEQADCVVSEWMLNTQCCTVEIQFCSRLYTLDIHCIQQQSTDLRLVTIVTGAWKLILATSTFKTKQDNAKGDSFQPIDLLFSDLRPTGDFTYSQGTL